MDAFSDEVNDVKLYECHQLGGNQYWEYSEGNICRDDYCIEYLPPTVKLLRKNKYRERQVKSLNVAYFKEE